MNENISKINLDENQTTSQHEQQQRSRKKFTAKYLENEYFPNKIKNDNVLKSTGHYLKKYYMPNSNCMKIFLIKRFPCIEWISKYDLKQYFLKDFIAGLTIGIVHIPQGMAYSLMAEMPAINGLYVSFFSILFYLIFGTSRHLSVGTYAIVSLMVKESIKSYEGILYSSNEDTHKSNTTSGESSNEAYLSNDPKEAKVLIAMTLSLFTGIFHILFSILHFGVLTKYLSDAIVGGFTTGAAYHVVVSQIPSLLGITVGESGLELTEDISISLIGEFIEIGKQIKNTVIATLIISIIACVFLYLVKSQINERFKKKLIMPVPAELIVVIVGTLLSYFVEFNKKWHVAIIGDIPSGFPAPKMPLLSLFSRLFSDILRITIVSFAINISLAKLFAKRHNYEIGANQELFSYGIANVASSFFLGFPSCVGLSRCVILESVESKTQAYGIYSLILILIVILFLGPLFKHLPKAILASIIVVALKTLIFEVKVIWPLFKKSKIEAIGWLITFLFVMIFNIDIGLYAGLISSLLIVILKSQRARSSILGNIPNTNIYECIDIFNKAKEIEGIRIIRYEESVYYANVDNFKYKILKLSKIKPEELRVQILGEIKHETKDFLKTTKLVKIKKRREFLEKFFPKKFVNNEITMSEENDLNMITLEESKKGIAEKARLKILSQIEYKHIILDCSCMNYIDSQGVESILKLFEIFQEFNVNLYLCYCKQAIIRAFKKNSLHDNFDFDHIFVNTHEAVMHILSANRPADLAYITDENSNYPTVDILDEHNNDDYFVYSF